MEEMIRTCTMLDRREAAKLLLVVSAGIALDPLAAAKATEPAPSFRNAAEELRAFMKLQSRCDDGFTNYLNAGTVYAAQPGRQSIALYAYEGLLRFHTRVLGADQYAVDFIEAGQYLDVKTGLRLQEFDNPLTGVANAVVHIVEGPMSWQWSTGNLHVTTPVPVLRRRVAWQHLQGQSALQFDNLISAAPPGRSMIHAAALVNYVGSTSELKDKMRNSVSDTMLIDSSINPWADWLAMGDAPGRLVNHIVGRKLGALYEVPERLLQFIKATRPAVLEGVDAWKAAQ